MKEFIIKFIIVAIILGVQYYLSSRKLFWPAVILPTLSLLGGGTYLYSKNGAFSINDILPFIILSICLLVLGLLERSKFKRRELEKMKKFDLIDQTKNNG